MEIACIIHSGYFDCRGAFRTVLDLYYCVTQLTMKRIGYFTFLTIIGSWGVVPFVLMQVHQS